MSKENDMGAHHRQTPSKRQLARASRQSFEQFVLDFNAEAAEQQAEEESDAEEFAERYIAALRRRLGLDD